MTHISSDKYFIIAIIFCVIYVLYLNITNKNVNEPFKKFVKNKIKSVTSTIKNNTTGQIKKLSGKIKKQTVGKIKKMEKKIAKNIQKAVKKSTKPLKNATNKLNRKIRKIPRTILREVGKIVRTLTIKIKKAIIDPIKNIYETIGKVFINMGGAIIDIFTKIALIPSCMIPYFIYVFTTLRDQVFKHIIRPILKAVLSKILPKIVVNFILDSIDWLTSSVDKLLKMFGDFFDISSIFTKDKCFDLPRKLKKRFKFVKDIMNGIKEIFSKFGKL